MTSLNNPVKLPLDANGNVLANINAQNINPNVNTAASVTGAVGSVTGNVGGSVAGSVGSVTGAVISSTLLSHQTGLSVTATAANTFYAIGSAISVSRTGILRITIIGHTNGSAYIQLRLTRGSTTYSLGSTSSSLFTDLVSQAYFADGSPTLLIKNIEASDANTIATSIQESDFVLILTVYAGDSLQFYGANGTAADVTYIDDLLVIEQ